MNERIAAKTTENAYSELLRRGISEVRTYQYSSKSNVLSAHVDHLIALCERIAQLPTGDALEQQLNALGRLMVDEFPLTSNFAPSISQALHASQRLKRRQRRAK